MPLHAPAGHESDICEALEIESVDYSESIESAEHSESIERAFKTWSTILVSVVIAIQFIMPLVYGVQWRTTHETVGGFSSAGLSSDVFVTDCPDLHWANMLEPQTTANMILGRENYQFYHRAHRVCSRRSTVDSSRVMLSRRCAAHLRIRDGSTCMKAASFMMQDGGVIWSAGSRCLDWLTNYSDVWDRLGSNRSCAHLGPVGCTLKQYHNVKTSRQQYSHFFYKGLEGDYAVMRKESMGEMELCLHLPELPGQLFVMSVSAVLAWVFALLGSHFVSPQSADHGAEDMNLEEAHTQVARGALLAAARARYGKNKALVYRMSQVGYLLGSLQLLMCSFRPWLVILYYFLLFFPLSLCVHGPVVFTKPVHLLVPPVASIFQWRPLDWGTSVHLFVTTLVWPLFYIIGAAVPAARYVMDQARNDEVQANQASQEFGQFFFNCISLVTLLAGVVYVPWTWLNVSCFSVPLDLNDSAKRVSKLSKRVAAVAARCLVESEKHSAAPVDPSTSRRDKYSWPAFEKNGVRRQQLLQPLPGCSWLIWPGDAALGFVFFVLDIITDTVAWSGFLNGGHYFFAGALATTSWWSTCLQLRRGHWASLPRAFSHVFRSGVATKDFIELLDSEKGLETLFALCVQAYAFNFAGLSTITGVASSALSLFLSVYGLSSYLVDNVDFSETELEIRTEDTTE